MSNSNDKGLDEGRNGENSGNGTSGNVDIVVVSNTVSNLVAGELNVSN